MTRITRSGARGTLPIPVRAQRRVVQRGGQQASTSAAAQDEMQAEEEGASQDLLKAPSSQIRVLAEATKADLAQCGACLDWFHRDGPLDIGQGASNA